MLRYCRCQQRNHSVYGYLGRPVAYLSPLVQDTLQEVLWKADHIGLMPLNRVLDDLLGVRQISAKGDEEVIDVSLGTRVDPWLSRDGTCLSYSDSHREEVSETWYRLIVDQMADADHYRHLAFSVAYLFHLSSLLIFWDIARLQSLLRRTGWVDYYDPESAYRLQSLGAQGSHPWSDIVHLPTALYSVHHPSNSSQFTAIAPHQSPDRSSPLAPH